MKQAAVTQVDLWRLAHPLAEVLGPRRQRPHHERAGEDVEIVLRRLVIHAKRAGDFRRVPDLAVVVRDHQPEAMQLLRRNRDAQLRNVAGEKRTDELLSPVQARLVGRAQKRLREPAAQPQCVESIEANFSAVEAVQVDEAHTAGQRLGHTLDEIQRRTELKVLPDLQQVLRADLKKEFQLRFYLPRVDELL